MTQLSLLPHDGRTRAVSTNEEFDVFVGRGRHDGGELSATYGEHMLDAIKWIKPRGEGGWIASGWLGNPHPIGRPCECCTEANFDERHYHDGAIERLPLGDVWHRDEDALKLFRRDFLACIEKNPAFRAAVLALRGKRLGCPGCPTGAPCHARIIAEWIEAQPVTEPRIK